MRVFLFCLLLPAFSQAMVDPRSGSMSDSLPGPAVTSYSLRLTYNSFSARAGLFGQKWCSGLETFVRETAPNEAEIRFCGAGLREKFVKKSGHYFSVLNQTRRLERSPDNWTLHSVDDGIQSFDSRGRLISKEKGVETLQVTWASGTWPIKFTMSGEQFSLTAAQNEVNISGAGHKYRYQKSLGLLQKVWQDEKLVAEFAYNKLGDLISWQANGVSKTFQYDAAHRISRVVHNGCQDLIAFSTPLKPRRLVRVETRCAGRPPEMVTYQSTCADAKCSQLKSLVSKRGKESPASLTYDSLGRITRTQGPAGFSQISYRADGLVDRVTRESGSSFSINYSSGHERIHSIAWFPPGEAPYTTALIYDAKGEVVGFRAPQRDVLLSKDSQGEFSSARVNGKTYSMAAEPAQKAVQEVFMKAQLQLSYPVRR